MGNLFTTFTNCRLCVNGQLVEGERLVVSQDTGEILRSTGYIGGEIVDLEDAIVAPGFLDLYSCVPPGNSLNQDLFSSKIERYVKQGVTGYWTTVYGSPHQIDALSQDVAKLSLCGPMQLGIHVACVNQDALNGMRLGELPPNLKLVTLPIGCLDQISQLSDRGIKVAMMSNVKALGSDNSSSSSTSYYAQGESALYAGATAIAAPLVNSITADDPGPLGLLTLHHRLAPYLLLPADGGSEALEGALHPRTTMLLFNASLASKRAILCSSASYAALLREATPGSVLASSGLTTTTYEDSSMDELIRNIYFSSNCDIAQAVQAVTENVASFMGLRDRGRLAEGYRADFVVLDDGGNVKQTWIGGRRVWPPPDENDDGDDDW